MSEGTEVAHFRGIACLHCGEPIELAPRVAEMEVRLRAAATNGASASEPRRFVTWCTACGKEAPYLTNEIRDFNGVPASHPDYQRPVVVPWRHPLPAARAKTA
jgi:hypothetical protein